MARLRETALRVRPVRAPLAAIASISALLATPACSEVREPAAACRGASWVEEIGGILEQRCAECHGGDSPAGDYSVASYLEALGTGTDDVANAIAGDAGSLILAVVEPGSADATHAGLLDEDELARLREWVVDCELSYFRSAIHPGGILNPDDPNDGFHGDLVREQGWAFELCAECHGLDFTGGKAERPCTTCHTDGPTACNVCHGSDVNPAPPRGLDGETATTALAVGAHQTHLIGGALDKVFDCSLCHVVPAAWDDDGHLFVDGEPDLQGVAEVAFADLAGAGAAWDRDDAACDVYCHGAEADDAAASNTRPVWTEVGSGQAACGACHGLPPSDHASDRCAQCHRLVVDATPAIIDTDRHLDGVVDVGDGTGSCSGCHGDADGPAPPADLDGNTVTTALGVGAHTSHLVAGRLRGPIPCGDCHLVPDQLGSAGHIDTGLPAEVFPSDAAFDSLALADGADPVWDRGTARCAGVYCHGGGAGLSGDASPGLNQTPQWTAVGTGEDGCGACHGIPPTDGIHDAGLVLTDCAGCHGETVDAFGNILITGGDSKHINGVADVP